MSDLIKDVQKQEITSGYVHLYELEYAPDSFARFYPGVDEDSTDVEFRTSTGAVVSYTPIPMEVGGFEVSSDGSYSRPEVTIANLGNVFKEAIGDLDYEDLIGKRLTRRSTLEKYLVGGTGDSGTGNAPVEFPKSVYVIDRLKSRNAIAITFELAAPFDLAGITVPRRVIIGGSCPFKYRGAAQSVSAQDKRGGCDWDQNIIATGGGNLFMNRFDEYIVPSSSFTAYSGTALKHGYYSATEAQIQLNKSAAPTTVTVTNYWQAMANSNTAPADLLPALWRRVRVYSSYSASATYYGYRDTRYNNFVLKSGKLWRIGKFTQVGGAHDTVKEGANWTEGDICGKSLKSCSLRFHALNHSTISGAVSANTNATVVLPFGGFPGVRQKR